MKIFTIGFTKTNAENFFMRLQNSGASKLIDVRLNNVSQLAGFAKKDDLRYFAKALCGMQYIHNDTLAPTQDILDAYKKNGGDWTSYENLFIELMKRRKIETAIQPEVLENSCLLCSEDKPHFCHRRLVAEYLREKWGNVDIFHL